MSTWPDFRPGELLRRLTEGGVDFVVVGGVAVIVQGGARLTKDVDICYSPSAENLTALGEVLVALGARLRGIEEDLPFVPDGRLLRRTQILTLSTPLGGLDLLVEPQGSPPWPQLRAQADRLDLEGVEVLVASIDDLIAMKRAAGRPQDLLDVETLEAARRLRGA